MNIEDFCSSLTEEQLEACVTDENQLAKIMDEGLSEENTVRFHRAMMAARRLKPDVTVEGVLEVALSVGLSFLGNDEMVARIHDGRDGDVIFYGIKCKDADLPLPAGGCIVSPDVAATAAAKLRRGRKPSKPGVRGV